MIGRSTPPKISIGLPVFNGENYLCEALDAILAQTFSDFELIIADNGSVDSTRSIVKRYAQQDSRIKFFYHPENKGGAYNFNFVFAQSSGHYFAWASHDDLFERTYLEKACAVMDADPSIALVYAQATFIDEQGRPIKQDGECFENLTDDVSGRFHKQLRKRISWGHAVFGLFRKEALAKTGLIGGFMGSDFALLRSITLHGKVKKIPEPLFLRRDHAGRSVRACPGKKERYYWLTAKTNGLHNLCFAQHVYYHIGNVFRAELDAASRRKCLISIAAWSCQRSLISIAEHLPDSVYRPLHSIYRRARDGKLLAQQRNINS